MKHHVEFSWNCFLLALRHHDSTRLDNNQQPIPTIRTVLRTGTVGDLPLLPYTSMVASCFVWIVYGILKREPTIYLTNIVEFTLSVYYFVEFSNYAPATSPTFPGSVYRHIQFVAIICFVSLWVAIFFQENISTVGDLTVILSILTDASPLAAIKAVLESKSSESIPWPFTLAALFNCFLWTVVGLGGMHDVYVTSPAVLGLMFSLLQVAVKVYFGDDPIFGGRNQQDASFTAPVEMPYPVLGSVRQVVMMGTGGSGNSYNPLHTVEDHDLQLDLNSASSNTDYVALGVPTQQQQQAPQLTLLPNNNSHPGGWSASSVSNNIGGVTQTMPQAAPTFHKPSRSQDDTGMESVLFNSGVSTAPPQQPPFAPMTDSFRARSGGGSTGQAGPHEHGF